MNASAASRSFAARKQSPPPRYSEFSQSEFSCRVTERVSLTLKFGGPLSLGNSKTAIVIGKPFFVHTGRCFRPLSLELFISARLLVWVAFEGSFRMQTSTQNQFT